MTTKSGTARTSLGRWFQTSVPPPGRRQRNPHALDIGATFQGETFCRKKKIEISPVSRKWYEASALFGGSRTKEAPIDLSNTNPPPVFPEPAVLPPSVLTKLFPTSLCAIFTPCGLVGISWQSHLRAPQRLTATFHLTRRAALLLFLFFSLSGRGSRRFSMSKRMKRHGWACLNFFLLSSFIWVFFFSLSPSLAQLS